MESVFGFRGNGFVIFCADTAVAHGITTLRNDFDKVHELDKNKLIVASGSFADTDTFVSYIKRQVKLYSLENGYSLNVSAAASLIRTEMATALRKAPVNSNFIFGGVDGTNSELYFIDAYGSSVKLNFAAHGYCSNLILSTFDKDWTHDMDEIAALELVKKCIKELELRFIISQKGFTVKIVDKNGIRLCEL